MRLCCNTASYSKAIVSGELTQLEWLDRCAHDSNVDGVEFDARFFPRTDDDYLAHLKKLCADRCLTVVGATSGTALGGTDVEAALESFLPWIDHAVALGAPLLRFACGPVTGSPGIAWREFVRGLKHACVTAKRRNVTLALECGAHDALVAAPPEMRRALKECDSAWLRVAMRASDLTGSAAADWQALVPESVIATTVTGEPVEIAALEQSGYRGFVSLCYAGERPEADAVPAIIASLRK